LSSLAADFLFHAKDSRRRLEYSNSMHTIQTPPCRSQAWLKQKEQCGLLFGKTSAVELRQQTG